jgi:hypothetical protein
MKVHIVAVLLQNIRDDCLELYAYVGRLVSAVDTTQRYEQLVDTTNLLDAESLTLLSGRIRCQKTYWPTHRSCGT